MCTDRREGGSFLSGETKATGDGGRLTDEVKDYCNQNS